MPSPFPGMNPYLEQEDVWHDFHQRFATVVAEVLGAQVFPAYIVKIDEHVFIHEPPAEQRQLLGRPDAFLAPSGRGDGPPAGAGVLEAPVRFLLPAVDEERQPFVEIRDRQSRQVITVVELLSPSNKDPGPDRVQYLAKRGEILRSTTSLVEIDLLRRGGRLPPIDLPGSDYCVFVSRAAERPSVGAWPIRLREQFPEVPVPLRPGEGEARIDLRAVLDRIYDAAGYELYVYTGAPQPPLSADDAAWAAQLVPGGGTA